MMFLYPIHAVLVEMARRELDSQCASETVYRSATGQGFDLRHASRHDTVFGFFGGWGFLLGNLWLFVAAGLWFHYWRAGHRLAAASRRAFIAVLTGVAVVLSTLLVEATRVSW